MFAKEKKDSKRFIDFLSSDFFFFKLTDAINKLLSFLHHWKNFNISPFCATKN